jgi:hypothetical protein
MRDNCLTKSIAFAAFASLPLSSLIAQDLPKSGDDSFDVEPPLLIEPREPVHGPGASQEEESKAETDPAKLSQQLEAAIKSAASAVRLVKIGVLAKVEAEQRALRVVRLSSELAKAQLMAAQEQVTTEKTRFAAGQATQAEVDAAMATLTQVTLAARTAEETCHKAELDAAELNLRRQRQLLKLGSVHKSDVTRAEAKVAQLQQGDGASH